MLRKYYTNNTLPTHQPTQKVATRRLSSFICQNEVNMAKEPLKVEQPLLESSSEIHKLVYDLYQVFPRYQNYRDGDNISFK